MNFSVSLCVTHLRVHHKGNTGRLGWQNRPSKGRTGVEPEYWPGTDIPFYSGYSPQSLHIYCPLLSQHLLKLAANIFVGLILLEGQNGKQCKINILQTKLALSASGRLNNGVHIFLSPSNSAGNTCWTTNSDGMFESTVRTTSNANPDWDREEQDTTLSYPSSSHAKVSNRGAGYHAFEMIVRSTVDVSFNVNSDSTASSRDITGNYADLTLYEHEVQSIAHVKLSIG